MRPRFRYGSGVFTYVITECGGYAPGGVGEDPGGVEGGAEGDVSGIADGKGGVIRNKKRIEKRRGYIKKVSLTPFLHVKVCR